MPGGKQKMAGSLDFTKWEGDLWKDAGIAEEKQRKTLILLNGRGSHGSSWLNVPKKVHEEKKEAA